jgi:hypothetical protein
MKLKALGATRKQIHGTPEVAKESDYENEKVYPELDLSGLLAEQMGAAELKQGQKITMAVQFEVKRHVTTVADKKKSYSMTLCAVKAAPMEAPESDDEEDEEEESAEDDGKSESPALNYIHRMAAGG